MSKKHFADWLHFWAYSQNLEMYASTWDKKWLEKESCCKGNM